MKSKTALSGILCASALLLAPLAQSAEASFPSRAVRIVLPYAPGAAYDNFSRALANDLAKVWGQPVIVDNKPGATGMISADYVKQAPPDGYTLMLASETAFVTNPMVFSDLRYDPKKDFSPVTHLIDGQLIYLVRPGLEVSSMKEFIDLAKTKEGGISYGSSGTGGLGHIAYAWLSKSADIDLMHIPYKGAAPAIAAMLGSHVDATFAPLGAVEGHLKSGALRALAVTGPTRLEGLPEVATVTEAGYPNIDTTFFLALVAPADTPLAIREKIANDVHKVIHAKEFSDQHVKRYGYIAIGNQPDEFATFLVEDEARRREWVEAANIEPGSASQ